VKSPSWGARQKVSVEVKPLEGGGNLPSKASTNKKIYGKV